MDPMLNTTIGQSGVSVAANPSPWEVQIAELDATMRAMDSAVGRLEMRCSIARRPVPPRDTLAQPLREIEQEPSELVHAMRSRNIELHRLVVRVDELHDALDL